MDLVKHSQKYDAVQKLLGLAECQMAGDSIRFVLFKWSGSLMYGDSKHLQL